MKPKLIRRYLGSVGREQAVIALHSKSVKTEKGRRWIEKRLINRKQG